MDTSVPSPSSATTPDTTVSVPDITPREYTMEEIALHNKRDDMWTVIGGGVYDLTKFFSLHPGGGDVLVMYSGQDSTAPFNAVGHSREADELMKPYFIGNLAKK